MIKLPQLLLLTVAPLAAMAILSTFAYPAYANRVYYAVTGQSGDASDDVVWSNIAYPLAAFGAWYDLTTMAVVWMTGCFLAVGSAAYHSTYDRWANRLDVASMLTYLPSITAAVLAVWTPFAWGLVPIAAAVYWRYTWDINSFYHVPGWAAVTIVLLWVHLGHVEVWPVLPVALGAIPQVLADSDSWWHSWWHVGGAVSVGWVLYLI